MPGEREYTMSGGAPNSGHLHPFERNRTGSFQRFNHAETTKDADGLRAHVFGARLVARERRTIHSQHRESTLGEECSCGAAGGSGSYHEYVDLNC